MPLLRVVGPGQVKPVDVRLFLHAESDLQQRYNETIVDSIEAMLTPQVSIEPQSRIYESRAMRLGQFSARDELQILQLDEFQIPSTSGEGMNGILCKFSRELWDDEVWSGYPEKTLRRIRSKKDFFAIPFYENVALLAYRTDCKQLRRELAKSNDFENLSWKGLNDVCEDWEKKHRGSNQLFFDWPLGAKDNYNCLFFEILLSLEPILSVPQSEKPDPCPLQMWLCGSSAREASKIFHQLCHRAHLARQSRKRTNRTQTHQGGTSLLSVDTNAVVWRHWYTTLNQMMYDMQPKEREKVCVTLLPQKSTVAGEWYLGIPEYSAAPKVGLEIIKVITTREAELDRLRTGVGLPTRQEFYTGFIATEDTPVSPYFAMDVKRIGQLLMEKSATKLRRSDFGCYFSFSRILAFHLQRILEVPGGDKQELDKEISTVFNNLRSRMDFVRSPRDCSQCRMRKRLKSQKS